MANANIPPSTAIIQHSLDGFTIEQRPRDGYLNATAMCQAAGKQINDYARLEGTQKFLHVLAGELGLEIVAESETGYPVSLNSFRTRVGRDIPSHSVSKQSVMGNPITEMPLIQSILRGANQGTWIHPRVAIHLAQWLSPEFAVLVSGWVLDWMTTGKAPVNAAQRPIQHHETLRKLSDLTQEMFGIRWEDWR